MESANDCKIYSTRHTSMRRFREWRRTENTRCLQNKPCRDSFTVYKSVGVRDVVCYLSRGPLPFLVVPPTISSSCQCMYFLDRPWQPPLRARATLKGWQENKNLLKPQFKSNTLRTLSGQLCSYLCWVPIGCSEGAIGISRVQTGSIHVAMSNVCLFQHALKAFHGKIWLRKKLLRVKVGPL